MKIKCSFLTSPAVLREILVADGAYVNSGDRIAIAEFGTPDNFGAVIHITAPRSGVVVWSIKIGDHFVHDSVIAEIEGQAT